MTHHTITGGGGVKLHVAETGTRGGRPILFIHGLSQCWLCWSRQLSSSLGERYRLVAMDMRGHGLSEKPLDGYADSRLWAEDVHAVIRTLNLERPVLCGWSYGPLVILDYLRHFGEDAVGGPRSSRRDEARQRRGDVGPHSRIPRAGARILCDGRRRKHPVPLPGLCCDCAWRRNRQPRPVP